MTRISRMTGPGGPALFSSRRETREIAPGAVHLPDWLDDEQQADLVARCRQWVRGRRRLQRQVLAGGGVMSVRSAVLGRTWEKPWHGRAGGLRADTDDPWLPESLVGLGVRGVEAAYGADAPELQAYRPTTALISFYDDQARMGMHQDLDESGPDPIVSLSLGDACVFRFGGTQTRGRPYQDIELRSGDLFVFGRESRWAFHGVPAILKGTGDPRLGMREGGRLNITLRRTDDRSTARPCARVGTRPAPGATDHDTADDSAGRSTQGEAHGA